VIFLDFYRIISWFKKSSVKFNLIKKEPVKLLSLAFDFPGEKKKASGEQIRFFKSVPLAFV